MDEQIQHLNLLPIPGFKDYFAAKNGDIYSTKTNNLICMKQYINQKGYKRVSMQKDGKSSVQMVHRVIALTWIPNPNNHTIVNHLDGDKGNAHADNLEWTTHVENNNHAIRTNLKKSTVFPVLQIDEMGDIVNEFSNLTRAGEYLATTGSGKNAKNYLSCCVTGDIKTYAGYYWILKKDYSPETFTIEPDIGQFDKNGTLLNTFETLDAARTYAKLPKESRNKTITTLNRDTDFIWKYLIVPPKTINTVDLYNDPENWKPISVNPKYLVSRDGVVYSTTQHKILKQFDSGDRWSIKLGKNSKSYLVHRLVAEAFLPNMQQLPLVNHIDGNARNNHVTNLEWCTHSHNVNHAIETGLTKTRKRVTQYSLDDKRINSFNSVKAAAEHIGCSASAISNACREIVLTSGGFKWKYE